MEEDQLAKIWKSLSENKTIHVNITQLINDMKTNLKIAEKRANRRDKRELVGAILAIILFISLAIEHNTTIVWLACVISIVVVLYLMLRLKKSKKKLPENFLSLSVLEQLAIEKKYVKTQQHLLHTATYWYALPLFIVQVFFIFSMVASKAENTASILSLLAKNAVVLAITVLFLLVLTVFIGRRNKKAARENWAPIVREIENLERELKN